MTGSVWLDVALFVVFITVLSVATFRLDTIMSTTRPKDDKPQKNFCGTDESGKMTLTDPDGRDARRKRRA
jgi:NADH:ubiquinone oxidoreductase subunit 3 (subunit A)